LTFSNQTFPPPVVGWVSVMAMGMVTGMGMGMGMESVLVQHIPTIRTNALCLFTLTPS